MTSPHAAFTAHRQTRWMRPDAARYLRPDAAKYLKPGSDPAQVYPALVRRRDAIRRADKRAFDGALAIERALLDDLRSDLAQITSDLAWHRLRQAIVRKYSPDQPRVPAGDTDGGQWTSGGGGSGRPRIVIRRSNPEDDGAGDGGLLDEIVVDGVDAGSAFDGFDAGAAFDGGFGGVDRGEAPPRDRSVAVPDREPRRPRPTRITDRRVVSDADPEPVRPGQRYVQLDKITDSTGRPYYERGGHHYLSRAVYGKWKLRPETRRIFENSTSGKISGTVRTDPDGVPIGNKWTGENGAHGHYNKAVKELSEGFFQRLDISPEDMTVQQALDLLAEIRDSQDPRIRDFNRAMRMLRRIYRFRIGRGE